MLKALSVFFFLSLLKISLAQKYEPIDNGSKVHFVIKNLGFNTGGNFNGLEGRIEFDPEVIKNSHFDITVKSATIDTDNSLRDKNLRSKYFQVEKFPVIRMVSTKIENTNKSNQGYYYFNGNLIIKGVSQKITFPFNAQKTEEGWVFTAEFEINRLDYHVGTASSFLGKNVKVVLTVKAQTVR
jgi:polyisoprenoid-binding protein YceI